MFENLKEFINNRNIIKELTINDFKTRYAGSVLGIIWGFIQPLITILVYWFVFQVGLKSGNRPDGTPYLLWLICGIIPWFYFSEALATTSNVLLEYGYLVKKVMFNIEILPIIKILSALIVHSFFIIFNIVVLYIYGYKFQIIYIQFIYYLICTMLLLIGVTKITSSIVVFFRDMAQIVSIIIQIGFWLIPIVWSPEIIGAKYSMIFKFNPVYYIVEGYRDTFINNIWFWEKPLQTAYFIVFTICILVLGEKIFKRLKPHFSDLI